MRKQPTQVRAKERVDRILDATDAAIAEGGVASVTMNDIAVRAGVPIGSVYQYFSNRDEILKSLCDRHYASLETELEHYFQDIRSIADFTRDIRSTLNLCWSYTRDNPGYRALSIDTHAWSIMQEADWQDTLLNARRMAEALQQLVEAVPGEQIFALCVIVCDSASSTARFASRFEDLREALFDQFVEMVESRIHTLVRESMIIERVSARMEANSVPDVAPAPSKVPRKRSRRAASPSEAAVPAR